MTTDSILTRLRRRRDERGVREDVEGRYRLPIAAERELDAPDPGRHARPAFGLQAVRQLHADAPIHDSGSEQQSVVPLLDRATVLRLREEIPAALRLADIKRDKIVSIQRDAADEVHFLHQEIAELEARAASYRRVLQLNDAAPTVPAAAPATAPAAARFYDIPAGAVFHDSGVPDADDEAPTQQYTAVSATDLGDGTQPEPGAVPAAVPDRVVGDGWWDRAQRGDTVLDAMFRGGAL